MVRPPMLMVATFTTFAGSAPPPAMIVAEPSGVRPRRLARLALIRLPEPVSKTASKGPWPLILARSITPFLAGTVTACAAAVLAVGDEALVAGALCALMARQESTTVVAAMEASRSRRVRKFKKRPLVQS